MGKNNKTTDALVDLIDLSTLSFDELVDRIDLSTLSFDELESRMRGAYSGIGSRPTKPSAATIVDTTAAGFRKHADALEQYEVEKAEYDKRYNAATEERNKLLEAWMCKLRDEYTSDYSDDLFNHVYAKAYEDGHSAGYSEVRNYFGNYVDFVDKAIRLSKKS
jgi:hypothetical protein